MSPIHFELIVTAFRDSGYAVEIPPHDKKSIDVGLKYVNNDACYPSIIVIGQLIEALQSGKYDLNNTSVLISQTGGGCRATNYIGFLRKALEDANLKHIPVISLNALGMGEHPGFKISYRLIKKAFMALVYGDLLMRVLYRIRPYEKIKGSANLCYNSWIDKCKNILISGSGRDFKNSIYEMVTEFDGLEIISKRKPKVGLVGEILVKFHPTANNNIVSVVENEGAEAVMPDLMDFFLYTLHEANVKYRYLDGSLKSLLVNNFVIRLLEGLRKDMKNALRKSKRFLPPVSIYELAKEAKNVLSLCNNTGEGWFLTAEMIELINSGVNNIVCMQPFACLPNHVTGKGMMKELKRRFPKANIVAVDYDPGASEVNQINRIKLMLSNAFKGMIKEENDTKVEGEEIS
jgi:predicted nucleotide-binding protein (sugar kinase/HSP70/actin superfamily)